MQDGCTKCKCFTRMHLSLFFTETGSIVEKIEEFDARLLATDEVLLKSIEVSRIHQLFG